MTAVFVPEVLDAHREDLAATVRTLVERQSPPERLRAAIASPDGFDRDLWAVMAEQVGLAGLLVAEGYGGAGGDLLDVVVVQRELGRGPVPSPYLSSAVFAATLLREIGDAAACDRFLPGIAAGTTIAAVAAADWDVAPGPVAATPAGAGWRLTGERSPVPDAMAADLLLVPVAGPDGLSVFAVDPADPSVTRTPLEVLDLTRRQARVAFAGTPATLVGPPGGAGPAYAASRRATVVALVAEQVGGGEALMGMSLAYARTRHQFGRPIGGFQAVKHKLAEMALDVERMASVLVPLATEPADDTLLHLAKAYCGEAYFRLAAENIQIHGGIGFTWEHASHLYFRRAKSTEFLFGSPEFHRGQLLRHLGV